MPVYEYFCEKCDKKVELADHGLTEEEITDIIG